MALRLSVIRKNLDALHPANMDEYRQTLDDAIDLVSAEPVCWLPPERLPIVKGDEPVPIDRHSSLNTPWSRVSHGPRHNKEQEPYIPLFLGEQDPGHHPHAFKGRLDRDCETCGKPDRAPIHTSPPHASGGGVCPE